MEVGYFLNTDEKRQIEINLIYESFTSNQA